MNLCKHWKDNKCSLGLGGGAPSPSYCKLLCNEYCTGIGDTVETIANAVGASKLAKFFEKVTGKSCGCQQRKQKLNQWGREELIKVLDIEPEVDFIPQTKEGYAVITGCDKNHEKYIPLWLRQFRNWNSLPVLFADFGLSPEMRAWVEQRATVIDVPQKLHPYFKKPLAMLQSPYAYTLWMDLDCIAQADITGIFHELIASGKELSLRDDWYGTTNVTPWMKQAGVVAFKHGCQFVRKWANLCAEGEQVAKAIGDKHNVKDQLILSWMMKETAYDYHPLRHCYNYMVAEKPINGPVYITHYAGQKEKGFLDTMAAQLVSEKVETERRSKCENCVGCQKNPIDNRYRRCAFLQKPIAITSHKFSACPLHQWEPDYSQLGEAQWAEKRYEGNAILTGCDGNQTWMIPYWFAQVRKHLPNTKVVFCDYGGAGIAKELADHYVDMSKVYRSHGMWLKGQALLKTPYAKTAWMDIDCIVEKNCEAELFDTKGKPIAARIDQWWLLENYEADNVQTGVIVYEHSDKLIGLFGQLSPYELHAIWHINDAWYIRDQELFTYLVRHYRYPIHYMDAGLNYLCYEQRPAEVFITHYCAADGKKALRKRMEDEGIYSRSEQNGNVQLASGFYGVGATLAT